MESEVVPLAVLHVGDQSPVAFWDTGPPVGAVAVGEQGGDADHLGAVGLAHPVPVLAAGQLGAQHGGADDEDGGHGSQ